MIHFDAVCKRYLGSNDVLQQISFRLEAGQLAFLTGRSGAGKSTLLKLIAAIERPSRGAVFVGGRNISLLHPREIPLLRRRIGIVFQNHQLLADRSVYDNVALPLLISGYTAAETGRRVRAALDKVGLLSLERAVPATLSSGEQQRVGIARAVVNRPAVLLADEPTGNLDPQLALEIMNLFDQFNRVGVTVLIATHDLNLIRHFRRPLLSLEAGCLTRNELVGAEK